MAANYVDDDFGWLLLRVLIFYEGSIWGGKYIMSSSYFYWKAFRSSCSRSNCFNDDSVS